MDNAQKLFGDPSGETNFFATLDDVYAAFSWLRTTRPRPCCAPSAITKVEDFLSESKRITSSLSKPGKDTDNRIGADVDRVNDLLSRSTA
jgi:flagellar hook-associated protein 1 FlgK